MSYKIKKNALRLKKIKPNLSNYMKKMTKFNRIRFNNASFEQNMKVI